jgi:hypothetical protein
MGRKSHVKNAVNVASCLEPLNKSLQGIALPEAAGEQALVTFNSLHNDVDENLNLLRCYAVSIGKNLLLFRRIVMPPNMGNLFIVNKV